MCASSDGIRGGNISRNQRRNREIGYEDDPLLERLLTGWQAYHADIWNGAEVVKMTSADDQDGTCEDRISKSSSFVGTQRSYRGLQRPDGNGRKEEETPPAPWILSAVP